MNSTRREFGSQLAGCALGLALGAETVEGNQVDDRPVIDTHQHLWDLDVVRPPWLDGAAEILRRRYTTTEYREATAGLNVVKAVYMEVDVAPEDHPTEAKSVLALIRSGKSPTVAAVIGGRPASEGFKDDLDRFQAAPEIKGVRQVLHGASTPPGFCLEPAFVRGVQALGERRICFDLCLRPTELADGRKLVDECPDTRFVLDHCGNADPNWFREEGDSQSADTWRGEIAAIAERPNVVCKISGIVARVSDPWSPEDLAPVVNHCLDAFGPDRVMFGGDWPVCLNGASYREWIQALRAIVSRRPQSEQRKLFSENAERFYGLA